MCEEKQFAEIYCKCQNCGTYQLDLQHGLCSECLFYIMTNQLGDE